MHSRAAECARYVVTQTASVLAHAGIFVLVIQLRPEFGWLPIFPLTAGTVAGLMVNFSGAKLWVFRGD